MHNLVSSPFQIFLERFWRVLDYCNMSAQSFMLAKKAVKLLRLKGTALRVPRGLKIPPPFQTFNNFYLTTLSFQNYFILMKKGTRKNILFFSPSPLSMHFFLRDPEEKGKKAEEGQM